MLREFGLERDLLAAGLPFPTWSARAVDYWGADCGANRPSVDGRCVEVFLGRSILAIVLALGLPADMILPEDADFPSPKIISARSRHMLCVQLLVDHRWENTSQVHN